MLRIKYDQISTINWIITSHLESFYTHNCLPGMIKLKLMSHTGTGGLLLRGSHSMEDQASDHAVECIFVFLNDKKRVNLECLAYCSTVRVTIHFLEDIAKGVKLLHGRRHT